MTIEERAEQYANRKTGYSRDFRWREAFKDYAQGAEEQKSIDDSEYRKDMAYIATKKQEWIDKACEWLLNNARWVLTMDDEMFVAEFRKAIE